MIVNYDTPEENTEYWHALMACSDAGDVVYGPDMKPISDEERRELNIRLNAYEKVYPRKFSELPVITMRGRSQIGRIFSILSLSIGVSMAIAGYAIWKAVVATIISAFMLTEIEIFVAKRSKTHAL
jgi:hypothetical protein